MPWVSFGSFTIVVTKFLIKLYLHNELGMPYCIKSCALTFFWSTTPLTVFHLLPSLLTWLHGSQLYRFLRSCGWESPAVAFGPYLVWSFVILSQMCRFIFIPCSKSELVFHSYLKLMTSTEKRLWKLCCKTRKKNTRGLSPCSLILDLWITVICVNSGGMEWLSRVRHVPLENRGSFLRVLIVQEAVLSQNSAADKSLAFLSGSLQL